MKGQATNSAGSDQAAGDCRGCCVEDTTKSGTATERKTETQRAVQDYLLQNITPKWTFALSSLTPENHYLSVGAPSSDYASSVLTFRNAAKNTGLEVVVMRFLALNGKSVKDSINDHDWNANTFLPTVGKRGAAIIAARGLSSAASAANAAIDHMRDWALGSKGEWVTMGVPSNGEYGIPKDVVFGFPVTTEGGKYKIVEGLTIDAFSQECINKTLAELQGEQDGVKHLL